MPFFVKVTGKMKGKTQQIASKAINQFNKQKVIMKSIVFGVLILGVAFCTMSEDQAITLIHKIDTNSFGKTLLDTIFMQMQTSDPLDTLVATLHDVEDRYVAEQKEDDARNYAFQQVCNADIAAYDKDLAESNTKRIQLEAALEGNLYPRRAVMQGVVAAKKKEAANYQKQIDELDAERGEAHDEFEQKVRDYQEATAIITEARRLFEENLKQHGSFLQKGSKFTIDQDAINFIQKHLHEGARRVSKFKHQKGFAQIIKILATIASKSQQLADQGQVDRIVTLCNNLLARIEDSLNLERFAEDKRVEAYKQSRRLLTISLTVANSDLANCESELASINDQIQQTEASLDNTKQRIDNLTEARNDRWNQCEEAAKDYQDARAERDANRQVVSDCIGLVNTNLRTLKEQLALRLAAGDKI